MSSKEDRDHFFNNVFTETWCKEFSRQFSLSLDDEGALDVRDKLSGIAAMYEPLKRGNTGKATYDDDKRVLKSASNALEKSKEYLLDAFNRFEGKMRFHKANKEGSQLFYEQEITENGHSDTTDFQNIVRFIGRLAETCADASKSESNPPYQLPTIALEISLRSLIPCWKQHFSRIQYTEGAHYGGTVKYNSDALGLLAKIFNEIDPSLEASQIATALKKTKKLYAL